MQKQNNNFKKKKSLIIQICNSFIKIISNFIFPNKSTKRNIVIMSSPQQLCFLWFYSRNNFARFNNSTHNWNKYNLSLSLSLSLIFHFSIIISTLSLYYSHLNIFNSHFISYQSNFFPIFSLCQQEKKKKGNISCICMFFFFFFVTLIYLFYFFIKFCII